MHVIILAAGFAHRLGWLGQKTAKALLPVRGKMCCLDQLVGICARSGLPNVHIVHNRLFCNRFRQWRKVADSGVWPGPIYPHLISNGVKEKDEKLGAVGDLDFALKKFMKVSASILILCGDNFYASIEKEELQGPSPAITVRKMGALVFGRVGRADREDSGDLCAVSSQAAGPGDWTFAGPAFLDADSIPLVGEYCRLKRSVGLVPDDLGEFFTWLAQGGRRVRCIESRTPFVDIGTRVSYDKARIIIGRLFYG